MEPGCCKGCHLVLRDPHVLCQECPAPEAVRICSECFAKGRQFGDHLRSHSYSIATKDFALLADDSWKSEDELAFLNALLQRGLGNWEDVAKALAGKTPLQCRRHFETAYVENESGKLLDVWRGRRGDLGRSRDQAVAFQPSLDFPPRPGGPATPQHKELAGYNAARADFDFEPLNLSERDVGGLDFDTMKAAAAGGTEDEEGFLESRLQLAAVETYQNKLRARARTKGIVREMGLLNKSKAIARASHYRGLLQQSGRGYGQLLKMGGQLMCSIDLDYVLESLQHETNLRQQVLHLQEYRNNGLSKFVSTAFFSRLQQQRARNVRELASASSSVCDWGRTAAASASCAAPAAATWPTRRSALRWTSSACPATSG